MTIEEATAHARGMLRNLDGLDKAAVELLCRVAERSRRGSVTAMAAVTGDHSSSSEHFARARGEIERARQAAVEQAVPARKRRSSVPPTK